MPLSAAEKERRYRERRDNDLLRRAARIFRERKKRADLASGKKKLIAQQTDRGKRHHKCNILSKLIFGIMLYKNAAPFNPVLLL